jgi:hypothetical protein
VDNDKPPGTKWGLFLQEGDSLPLKFSSQSKQTAASLKLSDMAGFRRFVMIFCYDSAVLEAQKPIKPLILLKMVRDTGFEPVTPTVSR